MHCIPEIGEKMPPEVLICCLAVALTLDLLTSKSIQFTFVPDCTKLVNLAKFPQAVCKISCSQTFSILSHTDPRMDSPQTECLHQ